MGNVIDGDEGVMNQTRTLILTSSTSLFRAESREYGSDSSHPVYDTLCWQELRNADKDEKRGQ
jgi:hypothetical protein